MEMEEMMWDVGGCSRRREDGTEQSSCPRLGVIPSKAIEHTDLSVPSTFYL